MSIEDISIKQMQIEVEALLNETDLSKRTFENKRGKNYSVFTPRAELTITLGDEWVGYEFNVLKHVTGKQIGTSRDTDNYPLSRDNEKITIDIFTEAKQCLLSFIHQRIYVGKINNKTSLALPEDDHNYKIITRRLFSIDVRVIDKDELGHLNLELL